MKNLLSLREAALLLKISEEQLTERFAEGTIPSYLSPPNSNNEREVYFVAEEITE